MRRAPRNRRRTIAIALAGFAVALASVATGARYAPLMLGTVRRLPEHGFLRDWAAEYPARIATDQPVTKERAAFLAALGRAAAQRAATPTAYDPSYAVLAYPGGDVAADRGVCTDLVVRAFRDVGIDLQEDVHIDMTDAFAAYPRLWAAAVPDANIDHRRVPNLMVLFARHGQVLPISNRASDYLPGDIVTWHLGAGMTHIGIVTQRLSFDNSRPLVAHHVGGDPAVDDALFGWPIVGHFRYFGSTARQPNGR